MLESFQQHIQYNFPFLKESRVLIAVSAGLDSMALSHLCLKSGLNIALVHCNYQLRGTHSDLDEELVEKFTIENGLLFFSRRFETEIESNLNKESIQTTARNLRYEWFESIRNSHGYDYVLTAHHKEDNIETFLLNFSRGSGLDGLLGIPEINGKIIRPLLPFSKLELHKYATKHQLDWREDESNNSLKYTRNKIRQLIYPVLKEINPSIEQGFERTLSHLFGIKSLLKDQSDLVYSKCVERISPEKLTIDIDQLNAYGNQNVYLYQWLNKYGFSDWDAINKLLYAQKGKQILSETHCLLKDVSHLILTKKKVFSFNPINIQIQEGEFFLPQKMGTLCFDFVTQIQGKSKSIIYLDAATLQLPLTVRTWNKGDDFAPFGMRGTKKLSKFFKDEKMSIIEKHQTLLLCSANKIIWVIGKRASQLYTITSKTSKILKISYNALNQNQL